VVYPNRRLCWRADRAPEIAKETEVDIINRLVREEDGQDVVEYGLLIATIAIVVLVGTNAFGGAIQTWFSGLSAKVTTYGT
jgi:pilus assembly protein Flp/PilA